MPGTRPFFVICIVLALAFLALGFITTSGSAMPPEALAGFGVWRENGCESCHTIYGQGGAYAPDLTTIHNQRGETYLIEFLTNPAVFHPGLRVMPTFSLTRDETANLVAFLSWVNTQPAAASFPSRPINVRGGFASLPDLLPTPPAAVQGNDAVSNGLLWFTRAPAICSTCHSVEPNVVIVGPSLFGIGDRAGSRIPGLDAEAYIRQSIIDPGAYVVEGFPDAMARNLGEVLNSQQISEIITYLLTLG